VLFDAGGVVADTVRRMQASHGIALTAVTALIVCGCGSESSHTTSAPVASPNSTTVTEGPAKTPRRRRHRRTPAEEKKAIAGDWIAVGNVLRAKHQYNMIQGDQIGERRWRISRVCRRHPCRLVFARETSYKPLVAALARDGDHWVAKFDQSIPSTNGETRIEHSVWRLDLNGPRIAAIERAHTSGNCECAGSSLVVRWVATR
jgi:hypothetical protein